MNASSDRADLQDGSIDGHVLSPRWPFVARRTTGLGGPVIREVALGELEAARWPRENVGRGADIDTPKNLSDEYLDTTGQMRTRAR